MWKKAIVKYKEQENEGKDDNNKVSITTVIEQITTQTTKSVGHEKKGLQTVKYYHLDPELKYYMLCPRVTAPKPYSYTHFQVPSRTQTHSSKQHAGPPNP